jgi:hypothetical protein
VDRAMSYPYLADVAREALREKARDDEARDMARRWLGEFVPWRPSMFLGPVVWQSALASYDPNQWDGEWVYVQLQLPYDVADVELGGRTVQVPVFRPDPERAGWRRRKWWGRGTIKPWLQGWGQCAGGCGSYCGRAVYDRSECCPF